MWLKDCQDNLKESKCGALSSNRRFRHLLPRPTTSITMSAPCCGTSSNYCSCVSNNIVFSMNHHQTSVTDEQSSKDEKHMEHIGSSRWNPTSEQLMALEEMYRRGVRTPSAEEIKLIAAKLRQFGKIEGKNVFYWFQNHKARERQKRRRQPESTSKKFESVSETLEGNNRGFSCKDLEAEQNNRLIIGSKEPVSMQRPMVSESEVDGWTYFHDGEMQEISQRKMAKGVTKLMDLSCMSPNSDTLNTINASETSGEAQQKMLSTINFSIFSSSSENEDIIKDEDAAKDHQTLELFPLQNDGHCSNINATHTDLKEFMATMKLFSLPPNQFYEFL